MKLDTWKDELRNRRARTARLTLPLMAWLGGAFWVGSQPGFGFWDGVVWLWYVGRFIAEHATALH